MADVDVKDIKQDGTFIDSNGVEQTAVSLDQIFGMIPKPKRNPNPEPNKGKKKPTVNRGIKI